MKALILVDYQNMFKICERKEIQLDEVFGEMIQKGEESGEIQEIRLFVPNYQHTASPWRLLNHLQLSYGISVETCPVLREGNGEEYYKDLVDEVVFAWVQKYVQPDIGPELIIFVTGDGDFIFSCNEAKRKKKQVLFWILDPDTTSQTLFRYVPTEKLEPAIKEEINPFALSLRKKLVLGERLSQGEEERIRILKKLQTFLSSPRAKINSEVAINLIAERTKDTLSLQEGEIAQALEGLEKLGVIRIYPLWSINHHSPYFQWLDYFGDS